MNQVKNCQSFVITKKDSFKSQSHPPINFRDKNIFYKTFLLGILLFGFAGFSFAQTAVNKKILFKEKKALLNEKREISEKLRTDKKDLREVKSIINEIANIPSNTVEKFKLHYPKAKNVSWLQTDGFIEADYTLHKSRMVTFYDFNNNQIGTGKYVSYKSLPAKSRGYIAKNYKEYTPEKAMYYDDNRQNLNDMNFFGNTLDHNDYYLLLKNNKDDKNEIVLQITRDGEVSYFSNAK